MRTVRRAQRFLVGRIESSSCVGRIGSDGKESGSDRCATVSELRVRPVWIRTPNRAASSCRVGSQRRASRHTAPPLIGPHLHWSGQTCICLPRLKCPCSFPCSRRNFPTRSASPKGACSRGGGIRATRCDRPRLRGFARRNYRSPMASRAARGRTAATRRPCGIRRSTLSKPTADSSPLPTRRSSPRPIFRVEHEDRSRS